MAVSETTPSKSRLEMKGDVLHYNGIPVREMLAYPLPVAMRLLGVSRTTLWREINLGRLKQTRLKLIPRVEIDRYLAEISTN